MENSGPQFPLAALAVLFCEITPCSSHMRGQLRKTCKKTAAKPLESSGGSLFTSFSFHILLSSDPNSTITYSRLGGQHLLFCPHAIRWGLPDRRIDALPASEQPSLVPWIGRKRNRLGSAFLHQRNRLFPTDE